eukprot:TRINITY_DN8166_c0_g1_i12.p2 TRINITY_DN8166_c0_g1~~TRINITY_DN8166_c0_g1_i12.p2  ORF type:complete len:191 (-),score=-12.32 TRINITY_DN8166_c0_g1_i12:857-1429(-)
MINTIYLIKEVLYYFFGGRGGGFVCQELVGKQDIYSSQFDSFSQIYFILFQFCLISCFFNLVQVNFFQQFNIFLREFIQLMVTSKLNCNILRKIYILQFFLITILLLNVGWVVYRVYTFQKDYKYLFTYSFIVFKQQILICTFNKRLLKKNIKTQYKIMTEISISSTNLLTYVLTGNLIKLVLLLNQVVN